MATELNAADYLTRSVDRNRYFYGKLMTVRDFLREQEYFNSKRWLINRLLFGGGIVCGLDLSTVGAADTPTTLVEIEPGLAFDPVGREVTVLERARVDLSKVVGDKLRQELPANDRAERTLLVCLNYNECPKEPVPSLGGSPCAESCESNRVGETYTVSLVAAPPDAVAPWPCEQWLNRQTVSRRSDDFEVDRVAPVWVRRGEVFEVALKVTALRDLTGVTLSETVAGGELVEPEPKPPTQFPTTPVTLRRGEFFVYVYQVRAPGAAGNVLLSGAAGVPTNPTTVQVIEDAAADARDAERHLGACPTDPEQKGVPVARIKAAFNSKKLEGVELLDTAGQPRFRYSLAQVAELLDCVRASLRAEADSPRPGHLFITFKDIERTDLQPIGPAASHGTSWTVPRGDHVHALLLHADSGLQFVGDRFRIEGNVGGENIKFLKPVSGQEPLEPQHLATKGYVDSSIAGLDWQESVIDRDLDAPPPPPPPERPGEEPRYRKGQRHLIKGNPGDPGKISTRNPWAGHPGEIATWNGAAWEFTKPDEGTAVFVDEENVAYLFVEGKWIQFLATPTVAAGKGLRADGAVLSVGEGPGLKVNDNDVEVVFEKNPPRPVGAAASEGASATAARGDHTHELPLTPNGGLVFGSFIGPRLSVGAERPLPDAERERFLRGLHINGPVGGANIDFAYPVWGRTPTEPRHLATKQYVDGIVAGLDWQNSVLDKDLAVPPPAPAEGARYLVLRALGRLPPPIELPDDEGPSPSLAAREGTGEESLRVSPPTDEPGPLPGPLPEPDPIPRPLPDPDPFPFPLNPWVGHVNSIATWSGGVWSFIEPTEGSAVFVEDENTAYLFVDGSWTPFMAMPTVAAGAGLFADGARLSVGQGSGLRVNENNVEVVYHAAGPPPVGTTTSAGAAAALARGDHTHELPLALSGGLEFAVAAGSGEGEPIPGGLETVPAGPLRLRINGRVSGGNIDFLSPVSGQDPVAPRHLTTKQYVDGLVAGLTWQSTVLDKDLPKPPDASAKGDRYLLFEKPAAGTPWEGHQGHIATWTGRKWDFTVPSEGMAAFVADENLAYLFADGRWMQFLAPPAPVGAGAGLFRSGTDLAVGQGAGVYVSADAVSVNFGFEAPPPVGTTASPGLSQQAAQSDHTHALPLAPSGGLEFISGGIFDSADGTDESVRAEGETDGPIPGFRQQQLRVNGPVAGDSINFLFPVFGQTPVSPQHLATKEYVDAKGAGAAAGAGLVSQENVFSVGGGPGLVVGPDEVHVNFHDVAPQPVGQFSNPGTSNTVARGDHTHAAPDVWGTSVATGVVAFNMRQAGKQAHVTSLPIDPDLGPEAIKVVVGLESEVPGEGLFVGEVDHFEDAMNEGGGFRRFPSVLLGAAILPPGYIRGLKNTTFEIWARATERVGVLPETFRVRWWAYRPGRDHGVIDYMPPLPATER